MNSTPPASDPVIHSISQTPPVAIHILFYKRNPSLYKGRWDTLRAWLTQWYHGGFCHANIRIGHKDPILMDFGPHRGARMYACDEARTFMTAKKAELQVTMLVHPTRFDHWKRQRSPQWNWSTIANLLWACGLRKHMPDNCLSFCQWHLRLLGFREAGEAQTLGQLAECLQTHPQFFMRITDASKYPISGPVADN